MIQQFFFGNVNVPVRDERRLSSFLGVVISTPRLALYTKRLSLIESLQRNATHFRDHLSAASLPLLESALMGMRNVIELELYLDKEPEWHTLSSCVFKLESFKLQLDTVIDEGGAFFLRSQPSITVFEWRGRCKQICALRPSDLPLLYRFAGTSEMAGRLLSAKRVISDVAITERTTPQSLAWLANVECRINSLTLHTDAPSCLQSALPPVINFISSLTVIFHKLPELMLFASPCFAYLSSFRELQSFSLQGEVTGIMDFYPMLPMTQIYRGRCEAARRMHATCPSLVDISLPVIYSESVIYRRVGDEWHMEEISNYAGCT